VNCAIKTAIHSFACTRILNSTPGQRHNHSITMLLQRDHDSICFFILIRIHAMRARRRKLPSSILETNLPRKQKINKLTPSFLPVPAPRSSAPPINARSQEQSDRPSSPARWDAAEFSGHACGWGTTRHDTTRHDTTRRDVHDEH
jgi:hypothetical protein